MSTPNQPPAPTPTTASAPGGASQQTDGPPGAKTVLDLVVVIDCSPSMKDEAVALSNAVDVALAESEKKCPSNLRITYLGINGTWAGTKFDQPVADYLKAKGVDPNTLQESDTKTLDARSPYGSQEALCRAVIDVSEHFDWRDHAKRAIFVLGDENMDGGGGIQQKSDVEKNSEAIATAIKDHVKVYTYQGTPAVDNSDKFPTMFDQLEATAEYRRLAIGTGGVPYIYTEGIADFKLVLESVLCDALLPPTVPQPSGSPCDGVCDQLPAIIATINTLANTLSKAIDACCGNTGGGTGGGTGGNTGGGTGGSGGDCGCNKH